MNEIKTFVCLSLGVMLGAVVKLFGGWSEDLITLITLMAVDFFMGLLLAFVFKKSPKSDGGTLSSKSCFKGLCKKGVTLLFVLIARRLDITIGTDYIKTATVIAFITNELISIIENAGIMGIPMPDVIIRAIDLLKNSKEKDLTQD